MSGPGTHGPDPAGRSVGAAGFVLPVRDGEVLLARHTYGFSGWALVGGMALPGEPVHEAARREALEETGLSVSIGRLVAFADLPTLALFVFSARLQDGSDRLSPQAAEIAELRWFDAGAIESTPAVFEFSRALARRVLGHAGGAWVSRSFTWPDGSTVPVHLEGPAD